MYIIDTVMMVVCIAIFIVYRVFKVVREAYVSRVLEACI